MNVLVMYLVGLPLGPLTVAWRCWRHRAIHSASRNAMVSMAGGKWAHDFLRLTFVYQLSLSAIEWPWTVIRFVVSWRRPVIRATSDGKCLHIDVVS